jgi:cell division protein FtsZ
MNENEGFESYQARIMVLGCGGGGCNTITRLTEIGIKGANTVAVNTDAKHLAVTEAHKKILIGRSLTRGLGAGGYPEMGAKAAEESREEIKDALKGCDLLFVTCGLGGGTGTGSVPVISRIAKEMGAIVIAPVTFPFKMEGARTGKAEDGLIHLRNFADTTIIIENQKLLQIAGNKPIKEDYADVRAIMHSGGVATIGVGISNTKNRAKEAIDFALKQPLLDVDYEGATGALIQIIGGEELTLDEINLIGETVSSKMNPDATVMWGARVLPEYNGKIQVITIITGVNSPYIMGNRKEEERKIAKKVHSEFNQLGIRMYA